MTTYDAGAIARGYNHHDAPEQRRDTLQPVRVTPTSAGPTLQAGELRHLCSACDPSVICEDKARAFLLVLLHLVVSQVESSTSVSKHVATLRLPSTLFERLCRKPFCHVDVGESLLPLTHLKLLCSEPICYLFSVLLCQVPAMLAACSGPAEKKRVPSTARWTCTPRSHVS
jgi:hypothetical protein